MQRIKERSLFLRERNGFSIWTLRGATPTPALPTSGRGKIRAATLKLKEGWYY